MSDNMYYKTVCECGEVWVKTLSVEDVMSGLVDLKVRCNCVKELMLFEQE